MGIDSISPAFDSASKFKKNEAVKPKAEPRRAQELKNVRHVEQAAHVQKNEKLNTHTAKILPDKAEKSAPERQTQPIQKKISQSVTAMQIMSDKLRAANRQNQIRSKIFSVNQSLVQAKQELMEATGEKIQATIDAAADIGKVSYWDRLELAEKTRRINQLKEKIRHLEMERSQQVETLHEQVLNGTYRVSGEEILQGMLEEYF